MTSRQLPFQVTVGEDGRLQMDNIEENNACGYKKPLTAGGLQDDHSSAPSTPQLSCVTYQTSTYIDDVRFPTDGTTISFPVRLDFTLNNPKSNDIQVRFMEGESKIYVVKFTRGGDIDIEGSSATLRDLQFDGSNRFWVTYENCEVKVGLHGDNEPLVHNIDYKCHVDGIELYSKTTTQTVWTFYEPCTICA